MSDLIERLKAADGPSRELDAAICIAEGLSKGNVMVGHDGWCINSAINPNPYKAPAFTSSIDAAMTLVPEDFVSIHGWDYQFTSERAIFMDENGYKLFRGRAKTPALALCIAALEVRNSA